MFKLYVNWSKLRLIEMSKFIGLALKEWHRRVDSA